VLFSPTGVSRLIPAILLAHVSIAMLPVASVAATRNPDGCAGAVPNDGKDDSTAINRCLSRNATTVVLASGTYEIGSSLNLTRDNLIFTGQLVNGVAPVLRARPGLRGAMLVVADTADNWEVSNLVFDGNRANRWYASLCSGYRGAYSNIQARGHGWLIRGVQSNNTLCGTALEAKGSDYVIRGSQFRSNGAEYGPGPEPWADGITLLSCDRGDVYDNYLLDNTDVDLITGGGDYCGIETNTIEHVRQYGFAGIFVGYFNQGFPGLHATSWVLSNTVRSAPDMLGFGILAGMHPWTTAITVEGGRVSNNVISGAVHNLAIDGISSGDVSGNTTSGAQGTRGFVCPGPIEYTSAHWGTATLQQGPVVPFVYQHHYERCGTPD